jgi:hypothetical protein
MLTNIRYIALSDEYFVHEAIQWFVLIRDVYKSYANGKKT